jgi:hypothetical protein
MNQPAIEKDNALTRVMRQVAQTNAEAGLPAGRSAGGPANIEPPTRVRSAPMRTAIPLKPLTAEEKNDLDQKAKALGIMPKDELDELREADEDDEAPAFAAAPVPAPAFIPRPGSIRNPRRAVAPSEITARATETGRVSLGRPQLPDFRKVESFDLTTNTIYVDGMSFPIPPEDVFPMKSYAVQIVLDHVVAQLAKALIEFGIPEAAAMEAANKLRETVDGQRGKENVQEVSAGTSDVSVPAEPSTQEGLDVPAVPPSGDEGLPAVGEGAGTEAAE